MKQKEIADRINHPAAVDLKLDPSKRPLAGMDIDYFRSRHGLQTVDVTYALCIQNSATYNKAVRLPHLPYAMEMLIRLYDLYPAHAPWKSIEPTQAFDLMYGDIIEQFRDTEYESEARLALYRRFTAACGRSVYSAYRWIEMGGNSKRGITKIFARLSVLDNPREVLETIAKTMYKVRGIDFDLMFPLPTLANPPLPKPRGPTPKAKVAPPPAPSASKGKAAAAKGGARSKSA